MRAGGAECGQGELHPTAAQEHKEAQFRSAANGPAQGRTANGADCDTNNSTSLKEARVDHSEGGVCVTSIQGGVQRRNLFLLQYDVSAGLQHKTARSEEAPSRNCVCGLTHTEGQKWGSMRVLGFRVILFKKDD